MTITYYAHIKRVHGDVCDNCGDNPGSDGDIIRKLDAESIEDAKVEALAAYDDDNDDEHVVEYHIEDLEGIAHVHILAVDEEHDLAPEIAAKLDKLRAAQAADKKKRKLAKIERLKKEVGAS